MTNCIHCDIAERYSNPDTKISNTYDILWVGISAKSEKSHFPRLRTQENLLNRLKLHAASRDIKPIWSNARRLMSMES